MSVAEYNVLDEETIQEFIEEIISALPQEFKEVSQSITGNYSSNDSIFPLTVYLEIVRWNTVLWKIKMTVIDIDLGDSMEYISVQRFSQDHIMSGDRSNLSKTIARKFTKLIDSMNEIMDMS